ncbi:hypothetical protein Sme01_61310 [Sphaerisporangium melleum]|nr:hypothetical protein Sme01_61310 [Sphaerisporangium melleum]
MPITNMVANDIQAITVPDVLSLLTWVIHILSGRKRVWRRTRQPGAGLRSRRGRRTPGWPGA